MFFRLCQQLRQLTTHIIHWLDEERERRNQDESDMKIVDLDGVVMDDIDMTDDMDDINMDDINMDDVDSDWLLPLSEARLPATQCYFDGI